MHPKAWSLKVQNGGMEVRRSLPENFSSLFRLLLNKFSCDCGAQKTRPFDKYNDHVNSASKAPKGLIIWKVSVKIVSMSQTIAQQWMRRLGGWGGDRVPELPGTGAGRPQDTTSLLNEEVFWAWHTVYVHIWINCCLYEFRVPFCSTVSLPTVTNPEVRQSKVLANYEFDSYLLKCVFVTNNFQNLNVD